MFLSAAGDLKDRVEGFALGAVDFIAKPFQKEELLARIQTHLELSRLRSGLEKAVAERTASLKAANRQLKLELVERRRVEEALRESEQRFRSMADQAPVAIWTSGADGKIDFCNRYALTFTGRALDELLGDGWQVLIHPEDLAVKYPDYIPLIKSGQPYQVEYRVRRVDGEYRWFLDSATPRNAPDASFAGYVGIAVDITDLKRNHSRILASQKLESLGALVAGVAHNFNNAIGTIVSEADLALSEIEPDTPAYRNVESINRVAIRASEIVALLMAYASGGVGAAPRFVDVSAVVAETLQLIRSTVSKNITFEIDLAKNLPSITADHSRISQLVMSLLENACEALPDGTGRISVTTSLVTTSLTDCRLDGNGHAASPAGFVRLSVADTGCGIAESDQCKIFDPFYTTKSLGSGLGLPAVQGIVRSLGGSIEVSSAPGQGATFQVLLPCCTALAVQAKELDLCLPE
jgi:PAS domain S-box-containing protein